MLVVLRQRQLLRSCTTVHQTDGRDWEVAEKTLLSKDESFTISEESIEKMKFFIDFIRG